MVTETKDLSISGTAQFSNFLLLLSLVSKLWLLFFLACPKCHNPSSLSAFLCLLKDYSFCLEECLLSLFKFSSFWILPLRLGH